MVKLLLGMRNSRTLNPKLCCQILRIPACAAGLLPDCSIAAHTIIVPTQYGYDYGAEAFGMVGVVSPGCAALFDAYMSLCSASE